jgi:biotin synthase
MDSEAAIGVVPAKAAQQPQSRDRYAVSDREGTGYGSLLSQGRLPASGESIRHGWTRAEVRALFALPFPELMFRAQTVHRAYFDPHEVQISTLLSIKTGGCPEDCAYCPQSASYQTGVKAEKLMSLDAVLSEARAAKAAGASRFCMGAAWRSPKDRDLDQVAAMVEGVKALGLETCATLGMLDAAQARRLKCAGLDYYNHNLDTSPEYYGAIITTRAYQDRLDTLAHVRDAGISVCCGGIVGMGESREDRIGMIATLASLPAHPESVPINLLVRIAGTPLAAGEAIDPIEFVRTIAVARLTMPRSVVRLSAGREEMSEEMQALCFLAGANSIFYGPKLLTTPNPGCDRDRQMMERLGLVPMPVGKPQLARALGRDSAASDSPPPCGPCGGGMGVGVGVGACGRSSANNYDPPPQPSPTRGEGGPRGAD